MPNPDAPLQIKTISGPDAAAFMLMTFETLRPHLLDLKAPYRAFGATWEGKPCGLALGETLEQEERLGLVVSLFVSRQFRRRGTGRLLLDVLCDSFGGDFAVRTRWSAQLPAAHAFEKLLLRSGWSEKSISAAECRTTPQTVENFIRGRTLGKTKDRLGGFTWTSWDERSPQDDDAIRALTGRSDFPAYYDPYGYAERNMIWNANSMILRLRGVPIGWILTCQHWDAVDYDCQYVRPDTGRTGVIILMIISMIRRQGELLGPRSVVRYTVGTQTPAFLAISRGDWGLDSCTDHFIAERIARPENGQAVTGVSGNAMA